MTTVNAHDLIRLALDPNVALNGDLIDAAMWREIIAILEERVDPVVHRDYKRLVAAYREVRTIATVLAPLATGRYKLTLEAMAGAYTDLYAEVVICRRLLTLDQKQLVDAALRAQRQP